MRRRTGWWPIAKAIWCTACFNWLRTELLDVLAAFPSVRRARDAAHKEAVVEIIAAGIAFDDDVIAGLDGVFGDAAGFQAPDRGPLDFPLGSLSGLGILGFQVDDGVGVAVGEVQHFAFQVDVLIREIVRRDGVVREQWRGG